MIILSDLKACLDKLEEQEAVLLSWGDSGGFFTRLEVISLLEQLMPQHDPEELLLEMIQHAMLIEVPHPEWQQVYRTRMGESVHLYRSLRQWFHGKPLEQARTLVSDFRFVRRPRSYPDRKIAPEEQLLKWKQDLGLSEQEKQIVRALLDDPLNKFCLAGFQVRATERILKAWRYHSHQSNSSSTGTIVCAGTGSGKTLAFYLPAMMALATDICADPKPRVRILAIYPRKELLKDQFMETWNQSRKLDTLMKHVVGRKIRIGSLFGDTPTSLKSALADLLKKRNAQALPYDLLRCSANDCKGHMHWPRLSLEAQREELRCSVCGHQVGSDEVGLTRQSLSKLPPDILFTTTEMLNQHLGNYYHNHLFGVGEQKGPILVLLDEVHTYGGNTGAQTAYLLRRWMQRAFCRPHFVGLSATLADAENFFAELIGAKHLHVELIEPKNEEMIEEGAEYLLALRGDPVSQTALLSTTIQASMLTRRMLDNGEHISKGTWGSKTFVFTDDLDVNNRLYHQLSDAEGWRTSYRGLIPNGLPLASLRGPFVGSHGMNLHQRVLLGQDWRAAIDIGHSLSEDDRARIARTSSQDAGVDPLAEVIVATASLEVGFNDPMVGAVIQHKAPRDVSSYLQRKGRAGRSKTMRPWMLVVLSEFGRDRVVFQRYEDLVSPEIKRQGLPLYNGHIQKMQAAMAALDWMSMKLGHDSIWTILNKPVSKNYECSTLLNLIDGVLVEGKLQDAFVQYINYALRIDEDELQKVLWAPPRSLMMEFLPTLGRLLATDWKEYGKPWRALRSNRSPMPDFIPDALFSELNLPSVNIALQRGQDRYVKWEKLPFYQSLREFAPGRISKRYAIDSKFETDWLIPAGFIPVAGDNREIAFEIHEAFGDTLPEEGEVVGPNDQLMTVYRPHELYTSLLDTDLGLADKSNARLIWRVEFNPSEQTPLYAPPEGSWKNHLVDISFCMHQHMTPLEVTRYSTGSQASLKFRNGSRTQIEFKWNYQGQPVGIGARQWVDGMRLRFRISGEDIQATMADQAVLAGVRPVFFRHLVEKLPLFDNDPFQAGWVAECFLAAIAVEFFQSDTKDKKDIRAAIEFLASDEGVNRLRSIPNSLFQLDDQDDADSEQELQTALRELFSYPELIANLRICAEALWREPGQLPGFKEWIQNILGNTLTAATLQALYTLLPDIDDRAVISDGVWQDYELSVWLNESEPGGSGIIARLSQAYFEDPIRVLNIFMRSLQPGDYEQIDFDLYSMLEVAKTNTELAEALANVRGAIDHRQRRDATKKLHCTLQTTGFALSHSFMTVLHSRVLRPGSGCETDAELLDLLVQWRELEHRSGIEWALNIASHALATKKFGSNIDASVLFRHFCKYQGLLWPRGYSIRQAELNYYSPFQNGSALTERLLGAKLFHDFSPKVIFSTGNWLQEVHDALCTAGRVDLFIPRERLEEISTLITHLQLEPVDHLGLFVYPRIGSARREMGNVILRIELAEALQ